MLGTKFNLYDQSAIEEISQVSEVDNSPVILSAMASAKGTEDWFDLKGQDYADMFGSANFKAYGQVSIQNMRMIEAGARIVGKRLVADDATLANIIIVAKIYQTSVQKTDDAGALLYYDSSLKETTTVSENPVMIQTAHIRYEAAAATGAKSLDQAVTAAATELDTTGVTELTHTVFSYPILVIADNGRCVSNKRISIIPEVSVSKNLDFMFYTLSVYENGNTLQTARFAIAPDTVYRGTNVELSQVSNDFLTQVKGKALSANIELFVAKLAELSLIEEDDLLAGDPLFGTNIKGVKYGEIAIDTDNGIDLAISTGLALVNGSNGSFGDNPLSDDTTKAVYNNKLLQFFNGTMTTDIYNMDTYQVDAVFDANYPTNVKQEIAKLADYRKDFIYFRDQGLEVYTISDVEDAVQNLTKSCWITDFCQSFEILDTYSKKTVKVTALYTISRLMINHLINYRNLPFAGETNEAILTDALKGSLSFAPVVTPSVDEKTNMEDLRVNFASYFGTKLIVESLYTAQEKLTQLSFSNNVMALQRVLKVIRKTFPAIRYQFISNEDDLKKYTARINEVISTYASDFEELTFTYVQDSTMLANKIFRAALKFRFKDFAQAEIVDAYILPSGPSAASAQ
jgi:hypothetical protein